MYTNKQQVPTGGSHNFKLRIWQEWSRKKLKQMFQDWKKNTPKNQRNKKIESWPKKSVEISIRQVWRGQLVRDVNSDVKCCRTHAHTVGHITVAWGNAIIRLSCLTSTVISLFKLLRRCVCMWAVGQLNQFLVRNVAFDQWKHDWINKKTSLCEVFLLFFFLFFYQFVISVLLTDFDLWLLLAINECHPPAARPIMISLSF